jgi:glycosyltransferase involved in cell wall biosynthesis
VSSVSLFAGDIAVHSLYFIMKSLFHHQTSSKPKVSLILLDWSCRESFHILHYLNRQTISRENFEIIWIEYYSRQSKEIEAVLESVKTGVHPPLDRWILMDLPEQLYYHKHLMYNAGIALCRGEIVVICDSDAIVTPTFIENILAAFEKNPDIILHMDEVRNTNRKFYPFNYPAIDEVLGDGVFNWNNGTTTGLLDKKDPIHTLNYGACMCARREDLIAIGGADEHIDYLGHVCGPYEMTFRLRNFGKKEIWHQKEFLYHVWHPGQAGHGNYVGPHDGLHVSSTALKAVQDKRIFPLVENKIIQGIRENGNNVIADEEIFKTIIRPEYPKIWREEELSKSSEFYLWYSPELLNNHKGYNLVKHSDKIYGIPEYLGPWDLNKKELREHAAILVGNNESAATALIDEKVLLGDGATVYNHIFYAYPRLRKLVGESGYRRLKKYRDSFKKVFSPLNGEGEKPIPEFDYNILHWGSQLYALPRVLGPVDLNQEKQRYHPGILTAKSQAELDEKIFSAGPTPYIPKLLSVCKGYNLIKYCQMFYAIPQSLGAVNLHKDVERENEAILYAETQDELNGLIDQKVRLLPGQELIDTKNFFHIIRFDGKYYAFPQFSGPVDLSNPQERDLPYVFSGLTTQEIEGKIALLGSSVHAPALIGSYKDYNLVGYRGVFYGIPRELGAWDLEKKEKRESSAIFSSKLLPKVKASIDSALGLIQIEYAGWLPVFKKFGRCGSHPQFSHIDNPPKGYRFIQSRWIFRKWLGPVNRLFEASLFFCRSVYVSVFLIKLARTCLSAGISWADFQKFYKTRDFSSQALLPISQKPVFLPSVPFTFGQRPWYIEIEDVTTLFYPYIHNGKTQDLTLQNESYFKIIKILLEEKSCLGIITHMKSTADCLPKLFDSEVIAQKVTYAPLGLDFSSHSREPQQSETIHLLFTSSWSQDANGFYTRGGIDLLEAYRTLYHKFPRKLHLTLRAQLPDDLPQKYKKIIQECDIEVLSEFLPSAQWKLLLAKTDIYVLPAARIHVVSILEAMAMGIPIIASDGWGMEEYLEDNRNALLVKGRNGKVTWVDDLGMLRENYDSMNDANPEVVADLEAALTRLIVEPQLRVRLIEQARRDVAEKFTVKKWNQGLETAFNKGIVAKK